MMMLKMLSDMVKDVVLHQEAMLDLMVEKGLFTERDLKRLYALKARRLSQMDQVTSGFQASIEKVLNDPDFDKLSDAELLDKFKDAFPLPTGKTESSFESDSSEDEDDGLFD